MESQKVYQSNYFQLNKEKLYEKRKERYRLKNLENFEKREMLNSLTDEEKAIRRKTMRKPRSEETIKKDKERANTLITCSCGMVVKKNYLFNHKKTKKHCFRIKEMEKTNLSKEHVENIEININN
tara:strand:+ start:825 stop:1199 length:375 start_codon:yes stop_codon:yes gene_type:complete